MYKLGYTNKQIAESFKISSSTLSRMLLADPEYKPTKRDSRVSLDIIKETLRIRGKGATWMDAAHYIGYHERTLQRAVKYYAAQGLIE
jgi:Mn-dependent DtxR family transcriptional regulator